MDAPTSGPAPFDTRAELERHWRTLLDRAQGSLDLFDPDAALFTPGAPDVDAALRRFLRGGGTLRLALHTDAWLTARAPRFLRLLRDYGHLVACRRTPRGLRHLTDSFAIADGRHIVRRFHSDHVRGVAAFDAPRETDICRERFEAIWAESLPGLQPDVTGL